MTGQAESVAQDQIRAFVERILRMREEARAINADIREIYAEAKGNGLDKTVLGKVVLYVEKRTSKAAELLESEAVFDLYLSAFDGATGTRVALAHTHEAPRRTLRELRGVFAGEPRKHIELISEPAPPAANGHEVAADQGGEGGGALSADQSTAPGMDRDGLIVSGSTPAGPDARMRQGDREATPPSDQAELGVGTQARPVDIQSRPLGTTVLTTSADTGSTSLPAEGDADRHTVLMQEGGVEGEGQAGAAREHGGGEPSQPLLPSDRVENKPDGPAVIAAAPHPNCRGLQPGGCSFTHHKFGVACSPCNNAAMRERMEARAGKHQRVDA